MKTRSLGVDGNWVLHRAFHTQNYESRDPALAICSKFLSMVSKDALLVKATRVLVAFDGARVFRHDLYPGYKGERGAADGKSPYDYLDGLIDYLRMHGLHTVQEHKYEADDVLCSLAATTEGYLAISTRDKDAFQYVTENVVLLDSSNKPLPRQLGYADVEAIFGVPPELCLDLQTLVGDKIDNVPNLHSRAKAIAGLRKWGSLKNWLANDVELRTKLRAKDVNLNRKLVKLVSTIPVEAKPVTWTSDTNVPKAYAVWKDFANPKSKGLF